MSYQPINKPIPKYYNGRKVWGKRDCEDFKAYFWDWRYCKLSDKCKKSGYGGCFQHTNWACSGDGSLYNNLLCTGIGLDRWQKIIS